MAPTNIFFDYVEMFNSPKLSDFEFIVKNEVYPAHKFVLFVRNKFFATVFDNELPDIPLNHIYISDVEPADFKVFLKYLYTAKFEPENVNTNLLKIAQRYMDDNLKTICEEKLCQTINIHNVVELLTFAIENNCENLRKSTSNYIVANYELVKDLEDFKSILQHPNRSVEIINAFHCNTNLRHGANRALHNSFTNLFNSPTLSDLTITVKNQVFQVHKMVLFTRNAVFASMFNNLKPETEIPMMKNISIPEFEPEDFEVFLKYLYTSKFEPKDVNYNLLRIAHKYLDEELKIECGKILSQDLNKDNVVERFLLALESDCDNLRRSVSNWIVPNYETVKNVKDFRLVLQHPDGCAEIINAFHARTKDKSLGTKQKCTFEFNFDVSGEFKVRRYSNIFIVEATKWRIHVERDDNLYIFLEQVTENLDCEVDCEMILAAQIKGKQSIRRRFVKMFPTDNHCNDWGYNNYLNLHTHPLEDYVKDDRITVFIILDVLKKGKLSELNSTENKN